MINNNKKTDEFCSKTYKIEKEIDGIKKYIETHSQDVKNLQIAIEKDQNNN
jgi:hypothetical protein